MKNKGILKNLFAAVGVFFIVITFISVLISIIGGSGSLSFKDKIAVIEIEGIITDPMEIIRELREYGERADIKAIIIRIDSPGGAVGPSQEIHAEIKRLRAIKKVVVSMGTVAASGGYYIASAADKIVANPGTITGSIGVIIEFVNIEELFKKLGLKSYALKSGAFKDTGSPFKQMSKEEEKLLQEVLDDIHSQFVAAVSEGRGIKPEDVRKIADGRIFSGSQALSIGLVDRLGGLEDAIDAAVELAGISGKPYVIYPEEIPSFLKGVFGKSGLTALKDLVSGARIMYISRILRYEEAGI